MIAKSQENIQMKPSLRYLIPRRDAEKLNIQYEKWKMTGAIKVENEIIKDKSQSLAYAVKDRYENLKRDGVDFSEMTKEEFKDLFGDFDEEFLTKPIVIEAPNKVEGELSLKQIGLNEFPIEYRRYLEKEKNPKVRKPPKRPKPSNKPKAASPVNPAIPSASEPETPAEADNP